MGFSEEQAPRLTWSERIRFVVVAALCSAALLAGALFIADRLSHSNRWFTRFDHGTWVHDHGSRVAMLPDLLRRTCPGTSYSRVRAALGSPDSPPLASGPPYERTLEYDVSGSQFYVTFRRRGTGLVLYDVTLPTVIGFPDPSCWS